MKRYDTEERSVQVVHHYWNDGQSLHANRFSLSHTARDVCVVRNCPLQFGQVEQAGNYARGRCDESMIQRGTGSRAKVRPSFPE